MQVFGMESIMTFALVMMVFAATDNVQAATTAHLPVRSYSC
jgi:glycerol uptake facilitator-like aquaporin